MFRIFCVLSLVFMLAGSLWGADASVPVSKVFLENLAMIENEIVPLAEAMPADKYDFAPTSGEFKGVRTFGQQASHVATVIYVVSSSVLGEKNPIDPGTNENGPASLKTKEEIVKFLKDSFAYARKAMATVTNENVTGMVKSPFGDKEVPRAGMASVVVWHSFDHYGQMVVYARMNGIVPPASRK